MKIQFNNAIVNLRNHFIMYSAYFIFLLLYIIINVFSHYTLTDYNHAFWGLLILPKMCKGIFNLFYLYYSSLVIFFSYSFYLYECNYEFDNVMLRINKNEFYLYKILNLIFVILIFRVLIVGFLYLLYYKYIVFSFYKLMYGFLYSIFLSFCSIFFINIFKNKFKLIIWSSSLLLGVFAYKYFNLSIILLLIILLFIINYVLFIPKKTSNNC